MSELPWYVVHTRPRCEKKLALYCEREGLSVTVPCYRSAKKYRGKKVTFEKPLFPNYVFLRLFPEESRRIYQSEYVANLLTVQDQALFERQLADILRALETDRAIFVEPKITKGARVKIKTGPLRGLEGMVQQRLGILTVMLRLDFIGQAAAVQVDATELELIG